jgi:hypothetical protein
MAIPYRMFSPTELVYPHEMKDITPRPMVRFQTFGNQFNSTVSICLPIPMNISFVDAATYNDAELGFAGAAGMAAARTGLGSGGTNIAGGVSAGLGAIAGGMPKSLGNFAQALTENYNKSSADAKAAVSIGVGATLNKNITTQFTGTGTRRFSFQFKFISTSQAESDTINAISKAFRAGLYPKGNAYQLQYPPTWKIQFVDGLHGGDIPYLPKIFECYLDGITANYNTIANMFRVDSSPLDSEMTLTFIESRALTKDDIVYLEDNSYDKSRFLAAYNVPSATPDVNGDAASPTAPVVAGTTTVNSTITKTV